MPDEPILGPFTLDAQIGQGGMGAVWRAVHRASGTAVAIKVLAPSATSRSAKALRNEVHAVARLNHHGIVLLLDYGEVDTAAEAASQGLLRRGSPYFAMELASGRTLAEQAVPWTWRTLRSVLMSTLDALAHAHAREVIHRDIKPANILICSAADERPGLKLSDFGIAHALDDLADATRPSVMGTLHYMAPEQLMPQGMRHGPWTDLYALGCTAWTLATGHPPFWELAGNELARAKVRDRPQGFASRFAVPDGFEEWLMAMMEPTLEQRYQRAADAAMLLTSLPDIPDEDPENATPTPIFSTGHSSFLFVDPKSGGLNTSLFDTQRGDVGVPLPKGNRKQHPAPPLPTTWRRPEPPPIPARLVGAGLRLWGLRSVPLVGRTRERDRVWTELITSVRHRHARCAVLSGPQGVGSSRLAAWVRRRAHEVGAVEVLVCRPERDDGNDSDAPVRRMIEEYLGVRSTWIGDAHTTVDAFFEESGQAEPRSSDLMAYLRPKAGATVDVRGRFRAAIDFLAAVAQRRPLIVHIDEPQRAPGCLDLAEALLDQTQGLSVIVLLSCSDEALSLNPGVRERVQRILKSPRSTEVRLGPLPPSERQALFDALIPLEPGLAVRVEEQTEGVPQYAVDLIGSWVDDGSLSATGQGYQIGPDTHLGIPRRSYQVWRRTLEALVDGLPDVATTYLERAAVLGQWLSFVGWREVCGDPPDGQAMGDLVRMRLVKRLLDGRLAEGTLDGWRFANPLLRDSLRHLAIHEGRWVEHHWACALAIQRAAEDGVVGAWERLGVHLHEAGRPSGAIEPLFRGVRDRMKTASYRSALSLLTTCGEAIERSRVGRSDPDRVRYQVLYGKLSLLLGEFGSAEEWARKALDAMTGRGEIADIRRALNLLARALHERGRSTEALVCAQQAYEVSTTRDLGGAAMSSLTRAWILIDQGNIIEGQEALSRVMAGRGQRNSNWDAQLELSRGRLALEQGNGDNARKYFEEVLTLGRKVRWRYGEALALAGLADANRLRGNANRAIHAYRAALEAHRAIGSGAEDEVQLGIALATLELGRPREALAHLERTRRSVQRRDHRRLLSTLYAASLPGYAASRDWSGWEVAYRRTELALQDHPTRSRSVLATLELAAVATAESGNRLRASRVRKLHDAQAGPGQVSEPSAQPS